jgi:hypothetical protein
MQKIGIASALCFAMAASAAAELKPIGQGFKEAVEKITAPSSDVNFKISFKIKTDELESAGNFVAHNASQANYAKGGDSPVELESSKEHKGVEFKKYGTIVNCLPVAVPDSDKVDAQCQFELSGPLRPVTSLKVNPITSFQYQAEFTVQKGRRIVLVDEPDRRVEVKIEELAAER